jgi:hypothetical protein
MIIKIEILYCIVWFEENETFAVALHPSSGYNCKTSKKGPKASGRQNHLAESDICFEISGSLRTALYYNLYDCTET